MLTPDGRVTIPVDLAECKVELLGGFHSRRLELWLMPLCEEIEQLRSITLSPTSQEQLEVIRRIMERGLKSAQRSHISEFVDLFQHLLDELIRFRKELK